MYIFFSEDEEDFEFDNDDKYHFYSQGANTEEILYFKIIDLITPMKEYTIKIEYEDYEQITVKAKNEKEAKIMARNILWDEKPRVILNIQVIE